MKYTFSILLFFLTNHLFSLDYILEFQANINILKEFNGELIEVDQEQHLRVTREAIEVQKTLKP